MDEHCMTLHLNQSCMLIAPACALQSTLHALVAALLLGQVAAAAGVRGLQVGWIHPDSPAAGHMYVQPYSPLASAPCLVQVHAAALMLCKDGCKH